MRRPRTKCSREMDMKKIVGPVLSLLLLAGVGVAIYFSASEQAADKDRVEISGLIGSEKQVVEDVHRDDINGLKAHGRFLRSRFARSDNFLD